MEEKQQIKIGDKIKALFCDSIHRIGIVTRIVDHLVEIETEKEGRMNTPKIMCHKIKE